MLYQIAKYVCAVLFCIWTFCNCYVVHGGWSSWTQGACSKTCGGGIMRFNRTCNNPTPSCRGLPCRGISVHEEPCNEFCCPGKAIKLCF